MTNDKRLNLDDSLKIAEVETLKADVPLDEEQIGWLKEAYQKIEGYKGQTVQIKQIDEALSLAGEPENWNQHYLDNSFEGQLLSLRIVRLSKANKKEVTEYEKKEKNAPSGVSYWRPVVGNKRLYLVADKDNQLFFGIANPMELDGELTFESSHLARIKYER